MARGRTRSFGRGPLEAEELALAAVMASVTVAISLVGSLIPHAGPIAILGAVPLAIVSLRHRLRALLASAFAAATVGFIVAGFGPLAMVVVCATIGAVVGSLKRRGRGTPWVIAASLVVGPVFGAVTVGVLLVFSSARRLAFDQIQISTRGVSGILRRVSLSSVADWWTHVVNLFLAHWWLTIGIFVAVGVVWAMAVAWICLGSVLTRLAWVSTTDRLALAAWEIAAVDEPIGPLPMQLVEVAYRYPGTPHDALRGVNITVGRGEFVAVVGPNGSGKSTLARLLAGVPPTSGHVSRPGSTGLGRLGGVALIAQRPETQILGSRIDDDVTWGLSQSAKPPDVASLLETVGLPGMEGRETSTLSGGELQRLALAGALAHEPSLLISDESTAMIDPAGSDALMKVLRQLPSRFAMSVVHITHREHEAALADRVIRLDGGLATSTLTPADVRVRERPRESNETDVARPAGSASPRIVLRAQTVSHTYASGTPWAQPALHDVDLAVREGDGTLIAGENGSGKSTLAWLLAGLLQPTSGVCEVDGQPVLGQVGRVALSFQHARLQLQRPTVLADVRAAGGVDRAEAEEVLALVGLDPGRFGARPVDQLSGGQVRRAALAGLLARRPRALILDEPLAGLDEEGRADMIELLLSLRGEGRTLVVISHDFDHFGRVCPTTITLAGGRVVAGPSGSLPSRLKSVGGI
jgi:energy-coupling factor transport system ATP-binding protein